MRTQIILHLVAAAVVASATTRSLPRRSQSWEDYIWSYTPDSTAAWYEENGLPLPDLASPITAVETNRSYVVKLDCVACPFRLRCQSVETWQEPPQDNSLLLNFTVDDTTSSLFLNGQRIAPIAPLPLSIVAYQTNANLSANVMDNITSMHMIDESWRVGTKYGTFELQYEHTVLATKQPFEEWLQFDIKAIHMRQQNNPGSANLDKDGQKMVQVLLSQEIREEKIHLSIKDVQLVERHHRAQPIRMPCGKDAIVKTAYNPLEWDYYGKFGTWTRTMRKIWWGIGHFFDVNGFYIIIVSILAIVVWRIKREIIAKGARSIVHGKEDEEAAVLLAPDYEDAPPEYSDLAALSNEEEAKQQA
ncbi:hypothetical protein EJ04DRAFT_470349 [Polyplosphaeria fusca]|uniref:Uncharacterized protein n=1 Tax=Polyplosphaeria fusca TaxID=682080 RepID=A0A9P4QR89_9PLEO|nr:hypothetical protein EJ04DRAFT_470349 [Polyplosphaeria fusca]